MFGYRLAWGSFCSCHVSALLFCCSSGGSQPAASPESLPKRAAECFRADTEARALDQQREAAIVRLRSEVQKNPEDAERWAQLGEAYMDNADDVPAIDAFEHATRLAPGVASYWQELSEARWFRSGGNPKAVELSRSALLKCLELEPQRAECHYSMGKVQHVQGDRAAALQSFTRAAEDHPDREYMMAVELFDLGELEQSSVMVRAGLARTPMRPADFDRRYFWLKLELQIAERRGDLGQAQAAAQKRAEYARAVSPDVAFFMGVTAAVTQPPKAAEAEQWLRPFIQSRCANPTPHDCGHCLLAADLLERLAEERP